MTGILIVSHGNFAQHLKETAEMILGKQENFMAKNLCYQDDIEDFRNVVKDAVTELDQGDGVLVFTDLFGGSPTNAAAYNLRELDFKAVTGVNLPMVIEALSSRESMGLDELVKLAIESGKEGILDLVQYMKK